MKKVLICWNEKILQEEDTPFALEIQNKVQYGCENGCKDSKGKSFSLYDDMNGIPLCEKCLRERYQIVVEIFGATKIIYNDKKEENFPHYELKL